MTFPFGSEFTVGLEEELFLVDETTLALAPRRTTSSTRCASTRSARGTTRTQRSWSSAHGPARPSRTR